jgi:hypothetical protein
MEMLDPFTDEEHRARCMLLGSGWKYRCGRGYYVNLDSKWSNGGMERVDAMTLEPIDQYEYTRRAALEATSKKEHWYDRAIR